MALRAQNHRHGKNGTTTDSASHASTRWGGAGAGAAVLLATTILLLATGAATLTLGTLVFSAVPALADGGERLDPLPAVDPVWRDECGACHQLYHPGLLPARSWRAMVAGLDDHFGDNASLGASEQTQIAAFLTAYAADRARSRLSRQIARWTPADATPLRPSALPQLREEHDELRAGVYARPPIGSRANCAACHPHAEAGRFDEDEIRIPRPAPSAPRP